MVQVDAQGRRKPLDLPRPLPRDAHRADDERGAERLGAELLPLRGQHRDRLDRLAEAHVVGEDRADPEVAEEPQPAVAALLEREQWLGHRRRRRKRLVVPLVAAVEQRAERVVEDDVAELEPGVLELDARDRPDEVDHGALAAALEEQQRLLHLGASQCVPAPADADERLLRRRELDQLLLGERRVTDRELPVEPGECIGREQAARSRANARRGEVDAEAARRVDPVARQQHRHAELLEARNRGAKDEADVVVGELDPGGLCGVECEPAFGENGLDQAELPVHRDPRVGRAEEAEDRIAAVVEERGGEGQRRVVGRLEPELEDDGGGLLGSVAVVGLVGLVVGALVEAEAEQPGGAGAALEAAVDPVGEPALEGTEARMGRQLGLGRREAVEEELGRARTVPHEAVAEPDPRRAQPVARDLVDGAGVEVVDERVAVAVEGVRAHLGEGSGDRVERLLDRLVDRRAPVGEPGAAAVLELRVEEALRDRAGGEVEHGERRPGRPAELELRRCVGPQADQLGEPHAPCARSLSQAREVGNGGDSEVQVAGGEGAVGTAREHGRAHILLPQDLERCALGERIGLDQLGCGHEPFRIRVAEEVTPDRISQGREIPAQISRLSPERSRLCVDSTQAAYNPGRSAARPDFVLIQHKVRPPRDRLEPRRCAQTQDTRSMIY